MKKTISLLVTLIILLTVSSTHLAWKNNINDDEKWKSLFNGQNLDGWVAKIHHHELGDNYANTFSVKEGAIQINYDGYGEFNNRYGHLFYKEPFSSYHLKFEFITFI